MQNVDTQALRQDTATSFVMNLFDHFAGADIIMQLDDVVPSTAMSAERFEVGIRTNPPALLL